MPTTELFNGIAIIIDDEIGVKDKRINNIIKQIEKKNIPCVMYKELPNSEIINHFQGINFGSYYGLP